MIPDCVDVNELATGKRTDGVIFGFVAFLQKVAGAVAIALVGSLLTAIGYVDGVSQSPETLVGLKNMYAFLCGGIFLIATLVVLKYPLSKARHDKVLKAIDERTAGKEVDMTEFRDLI